MILAEKIALGTVQFGLDYGISNSKGKTSEEEVIKILDFAHQSGITFLDTAQVYGISEEVLGKSSCEKFEIVTKLNPAKLENASVQELIRESLTKLRIPKLYGVLFHDAQSALQYPKIVERLKKEKESGKIEKTGYSIYTPEELLSLMDKYGVPDLIQVPYSHLDRRFEELATNLHNQGVEIHTRSTFLQGLFFVNPEKLPVFFNPVKKYLKNLQTTFKSSAELAANLLNYVASKPFVSKVVIGINNTNQLKSNLDALDKVKKTLEIKTPSVNDEILMPTLWPKS